LVGSTQERRERKGKRLGKTRDVLSDVDGETRYSGVCGTEVRQPRVTCPTTRSFASHTPLGAGLSPYSDSELHLTPPSSPGTADEGEGERKRREERRREDKKRRRRRTKVKQKARNATAATLK
jgi:hypothetical protein